ncbi:nucleic-acid-binding protein from transposon X-element [Trichonephila clavipes]|uniref:Nucleic-acid-binding protein from transposon X-element n=1 Tax=Trichonephila clavipes TaxID=2585209 RepID=A0A8X6SZ14_TRICX|nr:nucleic-acid-binding protein from transposon X-element [Trichonephila clavipes]
MDNRNEPTDMDLIDSPRRTPTPPPLSACEQILQTKAQLQKMETFKKFKLACIAELQAMPDHHPDEPFYRRAVSELQEVEETINLAVSDLASFPPCVSPGCPHHDSGLKIITPKDSPDVTPTKRVVLKGLPRNFKVEEIQADLEELGFTPEKVNQLIGRRSKQPIPVFLVTLPRSIENLKIFHLKTLSYLSIRVEGYNGKGVTQCYTCNHFHHNSENCHLNPRCLKCGEGHITRECPITERLETAYCINCEMYGHMANWRGCPCFPKPPKGTALNNRNSYTNVYNSIIRPNVSYAQAANPNKISTNFNSPK